MKRKSKGTEKQLLKLIREFNKALGYKFSIQKTFLSILFSSGLLIHIHSTIKKHDPWVNLTRDMYIGNYKTLPKEN